MTDSQKLHLILVPDVMEPHWTLPESQASFQIVHHALKVADSQVFAVPYLTRDLDTASKLFGEFIFPLAGFLAPVVGGALVAWITGRAGRKLKLKVGDVELEACSIIEMDLLFAKVFELKI